MTQSKTRLQRQMIRRAISIAVLLLTGNLGLAAEESHPVMTGRVVDDAGEPIAGAILAGRIQFPGDFRFLGLSNEDGVFRFKLPEGTNPDHVWLLARAEGFGLVHVSRSEVFDAAKINGNELPSLTLPDAAVISGRLIDSQGQPVAGVRVRPYNVTRFGEERRTPLAEAIEKSDSAHDLDDSGLSVVYPSTSTDAMLPWVETDAAGSFTIDSVAPNCLVGLFAYGERTQAETILVRTDDGPAFSIRTESRLPDATVHTRLDVAHTVSPSAPIVGRVQHADLDSPIALATISPWRAPGFSFYRANELMAVRTDVFGQYRLLGMGVGTDRIFAVPPEGIVIPLVAVERRVEIRPDDDVARLDMLMPTGVKITGVVTDFNTGKPVPGTVSSYVFSDNPHLKPLKPSSLSVDRHSATVDDDGRYEINVLPGPGILTFWASTSTAEQYRRGIGFEKIDHHIDTTRGKFTQFRTRPTMLSNFDATQFYEVDMPASGGVRTMNLVVGEERTDVPLTFTAPAGRAVPSGIYYSNATPDVSSFSLYAPDAGGTVTERYEHAQISFFGANKRRVAQANDSNYQLAGWTWVEPGDKSATIELKPAASVRGRVVDAAGEPIVDAAISTPVEYDPTTEAGVLPSQPKYGYHTRTDETGAFAFVGLPAGLPLTATISQSDDARNMLLSRHYLFDKMKLDVGETRDLGEILIDDLREWKPE